MNRELSSSSFSRAILEFKKRTNLHTPKTKQLPVISWVLYDLANTIFAMGVVSVYFPLWIRERVGAEDADAWYGLVTALSTGIIFLVAPIFGAMTDRARRRMPFLTASTLLCVTMTLFLGRIGLWPSIIAFIVANMAFLAGLQVYDVLLTEVSAPTNRGRVGGIGVAIGYLGSFISLGLGLVLGNQNKPLLFFLFGVTFLLFSIPCFVFVKERENPSPGSIFNFQVLRGAISSTIQSIRDARHYPGLMRFLIGRIFYTDAINTVIAVMALYTVNVAVQHGFAEIDAQKLSNIVLMTAILFSIAGGFFWGWLTDRVGPQKALMAVLMLWIAVFALAAFVGIFRFPIYFLYLVASGAGFALGGIWSADRPFMFQLSPKERIGEFFGLYSMVGRFSAITGPVLWAMTTHISIRWFGLDPLRGQGISILVLMAMVIAGAAILSRLKSPAS
jgi:MFS transporter, UMF1 family